MYGDFWDTKYTQFFDFFGGLSNKKERREGRKKERITIKYLLFYIFHHLSFSVSHA